jgi:hypothetical protein
MTGLEQKSAMAPAARHPDTLVSTDPRSLIVIMIPLKAVVDVLQWHCRTTRRCICGYIRGMYRWIQQAPRQCW